MEIKHRPKRSTIACGCQYGTHTASGGAAITDAMLNTCNYDPDGESYEARANQLEWEHVVPASLMPARQFACWNEGLPECTGGGSRRCCESHDLNAQAQIFDLHNIVPSVGQVNALRSNKRYGMIEGEVLELGQCDFEWESGGLAEPAPNRRGDVARVWLYFADRHGLQLLREELVMYMAWSAADPPDAFEFTRNARIIQAQGNGNPFVEAFAE